MQPLLTLEEAINLIGKSTTITECEVVKLEQGNWRVPALPHTALQAQPSFDQSTYDGYVIPKTLPEDDAGFLDYLIIGEIAAGDTTIRELQPDTAMRIMTGGAIPAGGWKVIAQEDVQVHGNVLRLTRALAITGAVNIRKIGAELTQGALIADTGEFLKADQLAKLADAGHRDIKVHRKPTISFFCTGSELVESLGEQQTGLKMSSNRYLLGSLIDDLGCIAQDMGTVADEMELICDHLATLIKSGSSDIIISTGGMGPGKYDLLEEAFIKMGGNVIFNSILLRPGKSVLFGTIGSCLYFGLPGPPPAVRALFYELVRPAALRSQGVKHSEVEEIKAYLEDEYVLKRKGILRLKEAVVSFKKGLCVVRPARSKERANCYLLCPGHRKTLKKGELVTVHML